METKCFPFSLRVTETETTEGMFSKGYYLNHVNIIKSRLLQRSGKLFKL